MPRRSGGGGGGRSGGGFRSSGSSFRGTSSSPYRSSGYRPSTPQTRSTAMARPMPTRSSQYQSSAARPQGMGLGSMMATGMAFGAGSAIAHQAIGGMFGHHYGGGHG